MPPRRAITAELVHEAGQLIDRALDKVDANVDSPSLDQLAAARREPDPVARSTKTVAALKQGSRDLQSAHGRMQKRREQLPAPPEGLEIGPEAQRELDALKAHVIKRIRQRAEEEMARTYPDQGGGKRRRPPRRRMSV